MAFSSNVPNINERDYYSILGVSSTARLNEIKKSFRMLQRQAHPDSSKTIATRHISAKLNESYKVLSNPLSRLEYDLQHGFLQKTVQNLSKLEEFKRRKAKKLRESLSASAQRSRAIESNVSCTFSDGTIVKNCGLIISKAKYGLIDLDKRNKAMAYQKHVQSHNPPFFPPRSVPCIKKQRSVSNTGYDSETESAHHAHNATREYTIDVTDAVQCLVNHRGQNGGYIEIGNCLDKSTLDGFYIPSSSMNAMNHSHTRYLEIEYLFNRKYHYVKVTNFEYLCVPNQSHIVHIFTEDEQDSSTEEEDTKDHEVKDSDQEQTNATNVPTLTCVTRILTTCASYVTLQDPVLNNEIIELPSGKLAVPSRPSLIGLKKFSEIEKVRKEETITYEGNVNRRTGMYDMIKCTCVGLMVVGAIGGLGYYLVDRAKRQSTRKGDHNTLMAMAVVWSSATQDSWVLYIQRYWNWMLGSDYNTENDKL